MLIEYHARLQVSCHRVSRNGLLFSLFFFLFRPKYEIVRIKRMILRVFLSYEVFTLGVKTEPRVKLTNEMKFDDSFVSHSRQSLSAMV